MAAANGLGEPLADWSTVLWQTLRAVHQCSAPATGIFARQPCTVDSGLLIVPRLIGQPFQTSHTAGPAYLHTYTHTHIHTYTVHTFSTALPPVGRRYPLRQNDPGRAMRARAAPTRQATTPPTSKRRAMDASRWAGRTARPTDFASQVIGFLALADTQDTHLSDASRLSENLTGLHTVP